MHFHFTPKYEHLVELQSHYSIYLVVISVIFACVLSFTAIKMNLRANDDSIFNKYFWYILASLAMGYGIWSMHYIGMMALSLTVNVKYNLFLTITSIIPALLASFFAFKLASQPNLTKKKSVVSSILMGLGVCSMHFLGMFSMNLQASHTYSIPGLVVTLLASGVAFYAFTRFYHQLQKFYVQVIMGIVVGCSVAVTHYVAMFSMTFYANPTIMINNESVIPFTGRANIVSYLAVGMIVVLAFLLVAIMADKYVELRAKNYDPHTHLPNFNVFEKKLNQGQFEQIAVWEFAGWHELTNTYGYLFTEELMKKVIDLFSMYKGYYVDLYRISPNQLVLTDKEQHSKFLTHINELASKLEKPLDMQQDTLVLSAGCAFVKANNEKIKKHELFEKAVAILSMPTMVYDRSVIQYDENLHSSAFDEELKHDIISAMKNHELYLLYQPKILPIENKVVGYETLIRWNHPRFGFLSPAVFIPILEQKDRMILVTDWIINEVGKQIQAWRYDDYDVPQVAINIPGNYVTSPNLIETLNRMVETYRIRPDQIELEITETSFVKNLTEAVQAVINLRKRGYAVALDDFGTGLSSLSYLKRMQISTLKIDKSFVDGVPTSHKDASILQAIMGLGLSLNLKVVIEGVETAEQVNFIQSIHDAAIIQGYYYSKPISAIEVLEKYGQIVRV